MNERLHEMMMEATKDMPQGYYVPGEYFEKFAELLIRECAGLVQGVPTDTMGYHTADQKIKEHFGVEL